MIITKHPKSVDNPYGYLEVLPNDFDPNKEYPLAVHLHGNGGNGSGSDADLEKLVKGELPIEIQHAVDLYGLIVIATQVNDYSDGEVDHAIGYAVRNLPINEAKRYLLGTSFGGGRLTRWLSKSVTNAKKIAGAVSSCGLNWLSTPKNIADAGTPVIFFHAQNDGVVGPNATHQAVSSINAFPMAVQAKKVIYPDGDHWIWNKVFHSSERPWTGNEKPKTIWEYLLMLEAGKPVPVPMLTPDTAMVVDAGPDQEVTSDRIKLNGSNSRNYKSLSWGILSNPPGVNIWNIFYNGAGYHTVDAALEKEGVYVFKLTVKDDKGAVMEDTVQVVYKKGTTPAPIFKPTHIIEFEEGSPVEVIIKPIT